MNKGIIYYVLTFLCFGILSCLYIDPNLFYLKDVFTNIAYTQRLLVTSLYLLLVIFLFSAYINLLKNNPTKKGLRYLVLLLVIIGSFTYPAVLSYDVFNYLTTAKVLFFYHENPYVVMPVEFINDPYLSFTRAANKTALYGPVWTVISGLPFVLGFGKFISVIIGLKILVSLFYIGILYFIYKLSNKYENVVFFALNPLVVIEVFVSGHNDVVMMFFALWSVYLLKKEKYIMALLLLMLSIFTKFATIFLIPIFIYVLYRKVKEKSIDFQKVYFYSAILMSIVFLMSPIREELYPWYAVWILSFVSLLENKLIKAFMIFVSFGLLLRYIPYMLTGDYLGLTPYVRNLLMFIPIVIFFVVYFFKKEWLKKIY